MNKITLTDTTVSMDSFYAQNQYKVKVGESNYSILVSNCPTHNCQIFSIGGISNIFLSAPEEAFQLIRLTRLKYATKSTCLVDIKESAFNKIKDSPYVLSVHLYTNKNTGSKMALVLIDAESIIEGE